MARRRTTAAIVGDREAAALAATLGGVVRSARRSARLTLEQLGQRVDLSRSRLGEVERGLGETLPLIVWVRLGAALGRPFAAALADPGARGRLADSGHLEMQEWLLRVARRFGWIRRLGVATRSCEPRYSIDVLLLVGSRLILVECWNTLRDFGAAIRSTHRKLDETEELRIAVGGTSVHACWLVRPTAANRELVHRYPEAIRTAFPESARWVRVFERGDLPPDGLDFVWLDPSVGVHALRIRGGERA